MTATAVAAPPRRNVSVRLSIHEIMIGMLVGGMRRTTAIRDGMDPHRHARKSDWNCEIFGSCAEVAVAKYFGWYWTPGVRTFKAPDVGTLQVRSTVYRDGHLIIRRNDDDAHTFVLVITHPRQPLFRIVGMLLAKEAKRESWHREATADEAEGWWVPQEALGDLPW